jgi:hypothetical protein
MRTASAMRCSALQGSTPHQKRREKPRGSAERRVPVRLGGLGSLPFLCRSNGPKVCGVKHVARLHSRRPQRSMGAQRGELTLPRRVSFRICGWRRDRWSWRASRSIRARSTLSPLGVVSGAEA